jgi:hypothetical protein
MNYPVSMLLSAMLVMPLVACQKKEESMPMPETGQVSPPSPEFGAPPAIELPPVTNGFATPPSGEIQPRDASPDQ